jgi:hypothetical protein
MAIFSPKARRQIETAVSQLSDDVQRQIWDTWSRSNPEVRQSDDPALSFQELPSGVAAVALDALERLSATLSSSLSKPGLDDDEVCDLEGDIGFINVLVSMLIDGLHASRVVA